MSDRRIGIRVSNGPQIKTKLTAKVFDGFNRSCANRHEQRPELKGISWSDDLQRVCEAVWNSKCWLSIGVAEFDDWPRHVIVFQVANQHRQQGFPSDWVWAKHVVPDC